MHYRRSLGNPCRDKCPQLELNDIPKNVNVVKEKLMQEYVIHGHLSVSAYK